MKKLLIFAIILFTWLSANTIANAACAYMSTFTGNEVVKYVLYDGGDDADSAGVSLDGGQTFKNVTLSRMGAGCRTFNVTGNITVYNIVFDGDVDVAVGITLTAYNCAFSEAKVDAEGAGTIIDTDCQFSVADFGFTDKANGDFSLLSTSVLRNAGYNTGGDTDILGVKTPCRRHDIGAYEYDSDSDRYPATFIIAPGGDYIDWDTFVAQMGSAPGDTFICNFTGNFDADVNGTQLLPINITGTIDGDAIFDENWWAIVDLTVTGSLNMSGDYITME